MVTNRFRGIAAALVSACVLVRPDLGHAQAVAQTRHWSGQGVAPVYEGFDINQDGTYNMWFGYMNRNFEEATRHADRSRQQVRARRSIAGSRHTSTPGATRTCSE